MGQIADGVFHKGLGSVAERSFRPHVSCSRLTPDERFLMVADLGIDQIKVYRFDHKDGKITLVDTIRCELESAPKYFMFSSDGRFFYVLYELKIRRVSAFRSWRRSRRFLPQEASRTS